MTTNRLHTTWRGNGFWLAVIAAGFAGIVLYGRYLENQPAADPDWEYVEDILFDSHWYRGPTGLVERWPGLIEIRIFDEDGTNADLITDVIAEFNIALVGIRTSLVLARSDAPVNLVILARQRWPEIHADIDNDPFIWGMAWTEANDASEVISGYALVNARRSEPERRNTLTHELFHVVAGANHSDQRYDSIINASDHTDLQLENLGAIDRQLLRFLYLYLLPGDTVDEVRGQDAAHWKDAAP